MEKIQMRKFDLNDWNAYAGCEAFPKDGEPRIGEQNLEDGRVLIYIVDGTGLYIETYNPADNETDQITFEYKAETPLEALNFFKQFFPFSF